MNFDSLDVSSPKRVRKSVGGWDAFFPYYAGYPLDFADRVIASAGLPNDAVVLDPWNGSGTTTFAALERKCAAVGIDVNPAMIVIAKARSLHASEADSLAPLATEILRQSTNLRKLRSDDALCQWFSVTTASFIRSIERVIRKLLVGRPSASPDSHAIEAISPIASTFYVALFATCRTMAKQFQASNPTWMKAAKVTEERVAADRAIVHALFLDRVLAMAASLKSLIAISGDDRVALTLKCQNSVEPFGIEDVELVLSSPPYCTRIDYTSATRIELAVLSGIISKGYIELGRSMMGSTRVPNERIKPRTSWGRTCISFLQQTRRHASKASGTYYLRTHLDYFDKLSKSLDQISACLRPGGSAILVVQDSYYKEVHNDLASIVVDMADMRNLSLRRRDDFKVAATLAASNPAAMKYLKPKGAVESVLCFERL